MSSQALTWCRKGCGNNAHARCMLQFAQFKISNKQAPTCPLCREEWNMELLRKDVKGNATLKNTCAAVHCVTCSCLLRNSFYRCLECSQQAGNKSITSNTAASSSSSSSSSSSCPFKSPPTSYDFCEHCYTNVSNVHRDHHFVSSDATTERTCDVSWTSCHNPGGGPSSSLALHTELMNQLQNRDLSTNDYELLISLDTGPSKPSLPSVLLRVLPDKPASRKKMVKQPRGEHSSPTHSSPNKDWESENTCWCGGDANDAMRILPCAHTAHDQCLLKDLSDICSDRVNGEGIKAIPYTIL